jgi:hypothetical protein
MKVTSMNTKLKYLPILTILALTAVSLQPALADHNGNGARWRFDPQTIKPNGPSLPEDNFQPVAPPPLPHSVQSGSMPHSNMLGLDDPRLKAQPQIMTPPPQIAHNTVMPAMTSTKAVHIPIVAKPFQASFGKPISPPEVATLPKTAAPLAIPQVAKPAIAKALPAKPFSSSKDLHGKLLTAQHKRTVVPSRANALALGAPKVESYGKNVGYTPGAYLPMGSSGSGNRTAADVYGRVLSNKTHMGR